VTARRFPAALAALACLGLALRLLYGFSLDEPSGDAAFYHEVANRLADGRGFTNPYLDTPTAAHPPLFPALLSVVSLLGGTSRDAHQAAGCAIGAVTVVLVGLAGRRLAGPGTGLAAAGLAAVYPPLIANDSLLLSESAYGAAVALVILAALWTREAPSPLRALLLGAAIGLATLGRAEALLMLPALGLPLVVRRGGAPLLSAAVLCAGAALVILPWTVRNWIAFDRPVLVSTNDGSVISGANCDRTYGPALGQWDLGCSIRAGAKDGSGRDEALALEQALRFGRVSPAVRERLTRSGARNEAEVAARQRRAGIRYARDHSSRLPKVVAARVGRTWSVYGTREQVRLNGFLRGSPAWLEWLTVAAFAAVAALAVAGGFVLHRRRGPLWILLVPVLLVTITSAIGFGTPRFRQAAEISLVLLAAVALTGGVLPRRARADRRAGGGTAVTLAGR
jgi:4-amino-4-deoxy-L-arabinose transferase-like glycosyltransferase